MQLPLVYSFYRLYEAEQYSLLTAYLHVPHRISSLSGFFLIASHNLDNFSLHLGCNKSFRRAFLFHLHMQFYHTYTQNQIVHPYEPELCNNSSQMIPDLRQYFPFQSEVFSLCTPCFFLILCSIMSCCCHLLISGDLFGVIFNLSSFHTVQRLYQYHRMRSVFLFQGSLLCYRFSVPVQGNEIQTAQSPLSQTY